jgi:hypothetical protein
MRFHLFVQQGLAEKENVGREGEKMGVLALMLLGDEGCGERRTEQG